MLLQQPGLIGGLRLKNRVVMAPMGTNYSTTDGLSTARDVAYYAERARGGVGAIMTEAMVVTQQARPHHNSLCCYHDRFIPGLASIVEAIKQHDCAAFAQLNHRGALLRRSVLNMEPVGPSDWVNPNTGDAVRALRVGEIHEIQRLFVDAARRLWRAGYDGVELHAANGYLFQQFFTSRINKRTDEYGGSLDNRMRLLLETIDRVRQALPDLRLIVRLSASEYLPDGYSQQEIVELAKAVERAGVAAIDLSGGSNESPQLSKYCIQPPSFPRGCLGPVAKPIRDAVSIPVMVAGRVVEPRDAEALLESGAADFVSLGRALYADPHWCLKAFGKLDTPIRRCIACNVCFERLTTEKDVSCVQNPMVGTEFEGLEHVSPKLIARTAHPRRVLVLGAGVAGIEAARVLANKGHQVEVWERSERVGGQIHLAVAAPDKEEVRPVWEDRWQELQQLQVPVRTGVDADAARIRAFAPDHVLLATGSAPRKPPLPLGRLSPEVTVFHAWELFEQPQEIAPGARVTIVGAGMVGAELADLLRLQDCSIQMLEMASGAAIGMARNNRMELLERLEAAGVRTITRCRIEAAIGDVLHVQIADQAPSELPVGDVLVFATGPAPQLGALAAVEAAGVPHTRIGDSQAPGDFLAAVRDGWMTALSLDAERDLRSRSQPAPHNAPAGSAA
ncbi:NAD(P)/FAD-dependent oxidoreductase [Ramlibacter sp. AN1133]|uniref:NAD(P)/FAD-dependent oxidoreductase n=1 Tax=Ramlibacter sp. AN1133 TaxID=3133429 RepID=UPI0030BC9E9C